MQPVVTQGTDRNVKSISVLAAVGTTGLLPASTSGVVYRIVGVQVSMDAAGTFAIYHGGAYSATKVIAEGFAATNGGSDTPLGDWAPQIASANEAVKADITGGNARIVLHYIEIRVLG